MEQREEYEKDDKHKLACKLHRSLYGLKQAPRQWIEEIDTFLREKLQLCKNSADACMYVGQSSSCIILIELYVDDLLIASDSGDPIIKSKRELSVKFCMKDLGKSRMLPGTDHNWSDKQLFLFQKRYSFRVVERFGMQHAKNQRTQMDPKMNLYENNDVVQVPYREAIGSLM